MISRSRNVSKRKKAREAARMHRVASFIGDKVCKSQATEGRRSGSARVTGSINSLFAWQVLRCLVTSVDDARSIREAGRKNSNRSKIRGKLGRTVERSYTRDRL